MTAVGGASRNVDLDVFFFGIVHDNTSAYIMPHREGYMRVKGRI